MASKDQIQLNRQVIVRGVIRNRDLENGTAVVKVGDTVATEREVYVPISSIHTLDLAHQAEALRAIAAGRPPWGRNLHNKNDNDQCYIECQGCALERIALRLEAIQNNVEVPL